MYRRTLRRFQTLADLAPGAGLCMLLMTWLLWCWVLSPGSATAGSQVVVASYEGVINPVAAEYVRDALDYASAVQAQALILQLDTPGGLDTSMRSIIKDFTAAPIPVIVYVAPSGSDVLRSKSTVHSALLPVNVTVTT